MATSIIRDKSFDFALKTIKLCQKLKVSGDAVIHYQLLKCGTSIGANVSEASAASSRKDFINKMSIASKEARETDYWIKLLDQSNIISFDSESYLKDIQDIVNILTKIVKTSRKQ